MADVQFGAYVAARTAKTTVADTDLVVISDQAASGVGKKVTWANVVTQIAASLAASATHLTTLLNAMLAVVDIVGWRRVVTMSADRTLLNGVETADTFYDADGGGTALKFAVTAGNRYGFRFVVVYDANAVGTGSKWSINGPALTSLAYRAQWSLTATSVTQVQGTSAYDTGALNGTSAATSANMAIIEGVIVPSASGDVIARFGFEASGGAASITAKAGSYVEYTRLS